MKIIQEKVDSQFSTHYKIRAAVHLERSLEQMHRLTIVFSLCWSSLLPLSAQMEESSLAPHVRSSLCCKNLETKEACLTCYERSST